MVEKKNRRVKLQESQDQGSGRVAADLRRHNRAVVLELIRTHASMSRAALARKTQLSMATVIEIVDQLVREGLVEEMGEGTSTGGRRPMLLRLVSDARFAVGIEVGTKTLNVAVTDLDASVCYRARVDSRMAEGPEATYSQLRKALNDMSEQCFPRGLDRVLGMGVALPGPILSHLEGSFSPPSYPEWGSLRIRELLSEEYGLPVVVDNDANARALGEHLYGAGRGHSNMLYVICHRGVGGAAILDGDLRVGASGGAGEFGHTLIDPDGPRCGCGRYGCLEAFVGRAAIGKRARRAFKIEGRQELAGKTLDELKAQDVIEAALEGEPHSISVIRDTGTYLGLGVANMVNAFDPSLVIVGGSTVRAGDLLLDRIRKVVHERALPGIAKNVKVVAHQLGEDAGAVGAASLVLRKVFTVSIAHGSDQYSDVEQEAQAVGSREG